MTQNILFVASEMTPFIKTGGLGDVAGALPRTLAEAHHVNVKVVIPLYSAIDYHKFGLYPYMQGNCVAMGNCQEFFSVHRSDFVKGVETYFIEFNKYFGRPIWRQHGLYDDCGTHQEYQDNAYRFSFFCRAALQVAKDMNFRPDVVHVHDWQTSLIPYYLKHDGDPFFEKTKSLLTLHNLPYQGRFGSDVVPYAKIDWRDFNAGAFEDYGRINLLKGGIRFADKLNTVSPNYAREILTPEYGAGLDFLLRERQGDLVGILNGIDTLQWNPSKDLIIPKQYSFEDFKHGKFLNKQELRKEFGLAQDDYKPIFSMAVRLTEQKGVNMLTDCIEPVLQTMHCQFAIMGNGDQHIQDYLSSLPHKYPGQIAVKIGFDQETEHLMDAGSDFSLVPSIYEPCGLKQMVSQTYGALPVGRSTGGLEDTILNYNEAYGLGTGFKFNDISSRALYNTIGWANATYFDRPEHIDYMRKMAMKQDYSWSRSSGDYKNLYQKMSGVY